MVMPLWFYLEEEEVVAQLHTRTHAHARIAAHVESERVVRVRARWNINDGEWVNKLFIYIPAVGRNVMEILYFLVTWMA